MLIISSFFFLLVAALQAVVRSGPETYSRFLYRSHISASLVYDQIQLDIELPRTFCRKRFDLANAMTFDLLV